MGQECNVKNSSCDEVKRERYFSTRSSTRWSGGIISSTLAGTCAHLIPCFKHNMLQNHAEVLWEKKEFNKTQHDEWLWAIISRHAFFFFFCIIRLVLAYWSLTNVSPMRPKRGQRNDSQSLCPYRGRQCSCSNMMKLILELTIKTALQFTFETFVLVCMETLRKWITKFSSHRSVNGSPLHTCSPDCSIDGIPPENSKTVTPPSVY